MSKRSKSTNAGYIQGRSIGLESARADAAVAEAAALRAQLAAMSAAPIAPPASTAATQAAPAPSLRSQLQALKASGNSVGSALFALENESAILDEAAAAAPPRR